MKLFIHKIFDIHFSFWENGNHKLIEKTKELQGGAWKKSLSEISIYTLQERLDTKEKNGHHPFSDFSDVDMLQWFLQRREHLKQQHEKSTRTVQAYEQNLFNLFNNCSLIRWKSM
ncbi:hypothetical protein FC678_25145 [Peribacillus simplex]|uniref:Uncharacterized protein n=1 Tax=Peribacillus simplex TaxID=1478 RepID=A0A9X9EQ52_9BACI|nr:hypothetical protein [Peribacillus simplex]TKH03382.1 hypothetical protein FC678_25145 [Peribacillus simplex]